MYRVQIALQHKVVRSLYCQFVEDGELAEILGTEDAASKEFNQQFEHSVVESRGKPLEIPASYTIETVQDDSTYKSDRIDNPDPTAASDAVKAIIETTVQTQGLLEIGYDPVSDVDDKPPAGYETAKPSLLELLIDKILPRSLRNRKKTAKAAVYYSLVNMPIVTIKAFVAGITLLETKPIIVLKTFKELQTLPKAEHQLKAAYVEIAMHNRNYIQRYGPRDSKQKVLRGRQVFTVKRGLDRTFSRYKVQQVVRGFS